MIPCNDFAFYDQVLDASLLLGAVPHRYTPVATDIKENTEIDLYFAMARGYQQHGLDITAMEMTKWFDTNYHYIVPEFTAAQQFRILSDKVFNEFNECKRVTGTTPKPVLNRARNLPVTGKRKTERPGRKEFDRIDLLKQLLPVYIDVLKRLEEAGAVWVQLDEPFLVTDLTEKQKQAYRICL